MSFAFVAFFVLVSLSVSLVRLECYEDQVTLGYMKNEELSCFASIFVEGSESGD